MAEIAKPTWIGIDRDSWGLDHGTWSVLIHAFPAADIPVVQLSINAAKPFEFHVQLGAQLHTLRERGVLIVGSGNVVHNLGLIRWDQPDAGFDWARSFDEAAVHVMTTSPGDVAALQQHAAFDLAVPTPDHFIPLLYLAGLAAAADRPAEVLVDGYAMGSLSMTSYTLDARCEVDATNVDGAPPLPDLPADATNM